MSVSTATDRLASPRRVQPRHMVGALLLVLGLAAVILVLALSSTTSNAGRPAALGAHPAAVNPTQSRPVAQPTGAAVSSVPATTFRDPATHALLRVETPTPPPADSTIGHRNNP